MWLWAALALGGCVGITGSALASAVPVIVGAVGFEMSMLVIDRLTKLYT